MLVAVGVFLAKVAAVTVVAAVAAVLVIAGGASNVDSVKNARDGMSGMLDASRQQVNDAVVDDFNEPKGFWQRPDANERMSGQVFARGIAGGGKLAVEAVKAGTLVAAPVQTTGFDLVEKSLVVEQYMKSRLSSQASSATEAPEQPGDGMAPDDTQPPAEAPDDTSTTAGAAQPSQDDQPATSSSSPDGTYYVQPTGEAAMYVRSGDLEWHRASNYVTVDTTAESGWTVEGFIANGPDPATGAGYSTEYSLTSTETPWWDDEQGMWRLTVMVSQDGREPEICEASITRTGSLSVTYDIGGFPVTLGGSREG
jgi:hypothetical protein